MTRVRVGAIDCGTNTLRLLIADVDPQSATEPVRDVVRRMETVRLGEGIDKTGEFSAAALGRVDRVLGEYAARLQEHSVQSVRMVATSAARDARNGDALLDVVRAHLSVAPDIISGTEEAGLTAAGVLSALPASEPSIVLDIGGGSTEFIRQIPGEQSIGVSTDVGVVRLTERHLHHDPPLPDELAAVSADARAAVEEARAELGEINAFRLVGVAGTVTTAVGIALGLQSYDSAAIHGQTATRAQLDDVLQWSVENDTNGRASHPVMHPGRAAVFPAGMAILTTIMDGLDAFAIVASEADILDGIALKLAASL